MLSPPAPPVTPGQLFALYVPLRDVLRLLAPQPFCRADSKATNGEEAAQPYRSVMTRPGRQELCSLNGDITHTYLLLTLQSS